MIEVIYHREYNRVTVAGHAGSAPKGEDLVCAAVSILAHTLGENVKHLAAIGGCREPVAKVDEGSAEVSCKPHHKYKAVVEQTFQSVCVGFEILASKFPEYISFQILG